MGKGQGLARPECHPMSLGTPLSCSLGDSRAVKAGCTLVRLAPTAFFSYGPLRYGMLPLLRRTGCMSNRKQTTTRKPPCGNQCLFTSGNTRVRSWEQKLQGCVRRGWKGLLFWEAGGHRVADETTLVAAAPGGEPQASHLTLSRSPRLSSLQPAARPSRGRGGVGVTQ